MIQQWFNNMTNKVKSTKILSTKTSAKHSMEEVAVIIEDYDVSVQNAYKLPEPPPNRHIRAAKNLAAKIWWTLAILTSAFMIPGSTILLAHHHKIIPVVSEVFISIYLTFDLGLRAAFGFAAVTQNDESLFWKIVICLLLITGKEDLGHLHDQLFATVSSDILDILTVVNSGLSVPFYIWIIRDPVCAASSECQILAFTLLAAACFLVIKCLILLIFFKFEAFDI
ncbi:4653_t:CDS:2 [Ambispora gerdemannii]|uniref:4653_t:CDS:1 n=1 Tax=Ambispora gerdemannii TaxID=144530 RepID=A0A9N9A9N5_9GLOM|nr:4653_t:CDS:2 [Ambispora gerdemannii]